MVYYVPRRMISITPKLRAKLIKFRYGPGRDQQISSLQHTTGNQASSQKSKPGEAIWDFEIPPRWRRRPLDEKEIEIINNGGPL